MIHLAHTYAMYVSINWVFVSLARRVMCRKQKKRKESTCYKDRIKPPVIEVKLNFSTQDSCYGYPNNRHQFKQNQ